MATPCLVWFRLDLRLRDNPALAAAVARGGAVVPLFIWAPDEEGNWPPGAASRWWLYQSLTALSADLARCGSPLVIRQGTSLEHLLQIARQCGAEAVYWNRRYEPALIQRDREVEIELGKAGLEVKTFNSALLREPGEVANQSGKPFQVFTPFWKACLAKPSPPEPLPPLTRLRAPPVKIDSLALPELRLEPEHSWAGKWLELWRPGEAGAREELERFCGSNLPSYPVGRNLPGEHGTSRLSPHLHFGEIGPRQVWHAVARSGLPRWKESEFLKELGWREFAHHLLFHFPHTPEQPLRAEFQKFPWRNRPAWLSAWQRGRTGVPMVDAGMRELWATGWMHNRVRMIVGSFLVKNLLISWQEGARWFWDTLVDADLANNTLGWQWVAGCGADAAPYWRIFNPVLQGRKFDPQGAYVRRWIPELASVPLRELHEPWKSKSRDPASYPDPITSLFLSRELALEAYEKCRSQRSSSRPNGAR